MPTVKEALDTIPESMWDKIDVAVENTKSRPPDTFTVAEFGKHRGLGKDASRLLIAKLLKQNIVKIAVKGIGSHPTYYQLVK